MPAKLRINLRHRNRVRLHLGSGAGFNFGRPLDSGVPYGRAGHLPSESRGETHPAVVAARGGCGGLSPGGRLGSECRTRRCEQPHLGVCHRPVVRRRRRHPHGETSRPPHRRAVAGVRDCALGDPHHPGDLNPGHFPAVRSPGLDVGGDLGVPDPHLRGCRAFRHAAGSPPRRPISACAGATLPPGRLGGRRLSHPGDGLEPAHADRRVVLCGGEWHPKPPVLRSPRAIRRGVRRFEYPGVFDRRGGDRTSVHALPLGSHPGAQADSLGPSRRSHGHPPRVDRLRPSRVRGHPHQGTSSRC